MPAYGGVGQNHRCFADVPYEWPLNMLIDTIIIMRVSVYLQIFV